MRYAIASVATLLLAIQQGALPFKVAVVICIVTLVPALLICGFAKVCESANKRTDAIGKQRI
jgi:hypothetical protein